MSTQPSEMSTWAGSRWWKFDFHNHTPASSDYGKGEDQEALKHITPKEWLLNFMRVEIDCVAVTDHNSGVWIDPLKEALNDLIAEGHPEYRPIRLFPGVEISVQGGIHILAILQTEATTSDVDSLLGAVRYTATKGDSDGCTELSAIKVIDEILNHGGIAIPAHVDQRCGLLTTYTGTTLEQVLDHKGLFAMEVVDASFEKPGVYQSKNINWSEVLGSDSHHPSGEEGQCYPGSQFTWVKMSEPSLEGLGLALIDGDISLKRSDQFTGDPNHIDHMVIETITVDNAKYLGRGESFSCELNPWLNSIIGGRGTGKSTSLEFLRTVLNRTREIPENLRGDLLKYTQVSNSRIDEGLLTESTALAVTFIKDGARFRITWSSTDGHEVEEETAPDTWKATEGDIAQRFPIRIYSQKQIFELAKQPHALLKVVDDATEVNYREWEIKERELLAAYLSVRTRIREVEAGLQEESVIKGQLEDVIRQLEVFEKTGHADTLRSYQLSQNQTKAINDWEVSWEESTDTIRCLSEELVIPNVNISFFNSEDSDDKELVSTIEEKQKQFLQAQTELQKIHEQLVSIRTSWLDEKTQLDITKRIDASNEKYHELLDQLSEEGISDPSAYGDLVVSRQRLENLLGGFEEKRQESAKLEAEEKACFEKISIHREQITRLREGFLSSTLSGNKYVQISVSPFGNKNAIEEELRGLIMREGRGFARDIGCIGSDEGLLSILSDATRPLVDGINEVKDRVKAIYDGDQEAIDATIDQRFVQHIQNLNPEQIDRIRCWFPDDSLEVSYSLRDGDRFNPIDQGSPGQKTAALLAFILSYGKEPLILDQPEDDLDNYLIYDLIVAHLREIKLTRQVIIVTHNANIVVNGDAENVITLDIRAGQTAVVTQGSLQDASIRSEICKIMEGGEDAFDQRYKRIRANV